MEGLRTRESSEFNNFFALVQNEAEKKNCVFFFDTQESVEQTINNCECSNLSGWLIPKENVKEFSKPYKRFEKNLDKWEQFTAWVTWQEGTSGIEIEIVYIKGQ